MARICKKRHPKHKREKACGLLKLLQSEFHGRVKSVKKHRWRSFGNAREGCFLSVDQPSVAVAFEEYSIVIQRWSCDI